ncbi:hypothetical protein G6F22_018003 [Rhizopus arrhizus]|nr:hypothetical protein G6F22_018003 [Rhizopus arrhizus]
MHAGLGGGVVGLAVLALQAVDRADLDDPAPAAAAHALDDRAGDVEHRIEVGVDHIVPLVHAHAMEGGVTGDAGVVDQDLDRAQFGLDRAYQRFGAAGVGDLAWEDRHRVTAFGQRLLPGARRGGGGPPGLGAG